ncbi:hypothetical protein RSC2_04350 [Bacillus paralicheniformis]|nr:hypothetical protein RSC1_02482 [Bacillus paralicheniformis]BCE12554.1 hypothetical protein RSC2_04350 [Bacillus paralicheniformis]BCE14190.1 hypothetical protein RSC3_01546 [Bacillus paralicheniformis]
MSYMKNIFLTAEEPILTTNLDLWGNRIVLFLSHT